MDTRINEDKYDDLIDGRYEKTIYVKTWRGKTITAKINPKHTVENMKEQIEEKTKIPKEHQHLVSRGRVLMDKKTLKDYNMNEGETIEMTALQLGGTKNKSLSPTSMSVERETKRKASEPYIDVCGLEEEKFESAASEEETVTTKQWMKSMMREIKKRTTFQNSKRQ